MPFLTDGYQTLIRVPGRAGQAPINFQEREVQAPEWDGGGPIETTTMRNERFRTKAPKHLITIGDIVTHVQYDPEIHVDVRLSLQVIGTVQIRFPDGFVLTFSGWLEKFTPTSMKEGDFPLAEIKICIGNSLPSTVKSVPQVERPPSGYSGITPSNFIITEGPVGAGGPPFGG